MTNEDWLERSDAAADRTGRVAPAAPAQRKAGLMAWLALVLLRRRSNAMLRRTVGPVRAQHWRTLPPHLLRDIGLPPPM